MLHRRLPHKINLHGFPTFKCQFSPTGSSGHLFDNSAYLNYTHVAAQPQQQVALVRRRPKVLARACIIAFDPKSYFSQLWSLQQFTGAQLLRCILPLSQAFDVFIHPLLLSADLVTPRPSAVPLRL
jgi:hypothetical protein